MITKIEYSHKCSRYRCFWSKTKKDKQKLSYNNKWYLLKRKWCIYDALKILSTGLTKQRPMYLTFFACVSTSSSISREEALRFFIQFDTFLIFWYFSDILVHENTCNTKQVSDRNMHLKFYLKINIWAFSFQDLSYVEGVFFGVEGTTWVFLFLWSIP